MLYDYHDYFEVRKKSPSNESSTEIPSWSFVPSKKEASLWELCDTIPGTYAQFWKHLNSTYSFCMPIQFVTLVF